MQHQVKKEKTNEQSNVKKLIGIISGKGGVGKSYTAMLSLMNWVLKWNFGSDPAPQFHMFKRSYGDQTSIYPHVVDELGIKIISAAMLLEDNEDPLIWRGPLISDLIKQFYNIVNWGN